MDLLTLLSRASGALVLSLIHASLTLIIETMSHCDVHTERPAQYADYKTLHPFHVDPS